MDTQEEKIAIQTKDTAKEVAQILHQNALETAKNVSETAERFV